jgi:prevent-host-death family protein
MTVSVRDLKNRLSEYLRRVRRGERLVVTDRGRPVAELAPLAAKGLSSEERLERLYASGEVRRPSGRGFAPVTPSRPRGRPLSETLLEDRA